VNRRVFKCVLLISATVILQSCRTCNETEKAKIPEQKPTLTNQAVATKSGLKYQILKVGSGNRTPQSTETVTVHYAGWLEENGKQGRKFDSSVDRGKKFKFKIGVGKVIRGWDEGVLGMKVGEKRRLFIPYQLAYGERGYPGAIPPKANLIFDVELFNIN